MTSRAHSSPGSQQSLFPEPKQAEEERPHTCHARGCSARVPPELLMCGRHWRMVPRDLQRAVWRHYRKGQCDDKEVTRAWLAAADAAIEAVAEQERRR